jgi:hypothetical protein
MSTNKYKWFTLGLTGIVISGCSVGNKPNLNLGIADAFRKSRNCLLKKKMSYRAPSAGSNFGYAPSVASNVNVTDSAVDAISSESFGCGCGCDNAVSEPISEFYMPIAQEVVDAPLEQNSGESTPSMLPIEAAQDNFELENPLPADIGSPNTPSLNLEPAEEEGIIETLDSAAIDLEDKAEDFKDTPKKVETSILDTALKPLKPKTPTSAGESVVEQRSKMLTLTARPAQSHQSAESLGRQSNKVEMQQVTHKRHFREQNALRPLHQRFRGEPIEHTAEAPGPLKFKPLPVMPKEAVKTENKDNNTGAPSLNQSSSKVQNHSYKMRPLPSPTQKLEPATQKDSLKTARLPILKAESTSSAAISSLRNFTNVRDLDPGFDKGYYPDKEAEVAALKAVQVISDNAIDSNDDLTIER